MGYTNSPMVVYTKLSPNHSGQRTMEIDRITPHCVVGQCTAEGLGDWFYKSSTQASSNYGIDKDGRVGMYVEEKNRSWCSSSGANDQRAITIECASDTTEPYAFKDIVYQRLIELCVDICKRNGIPMLKWRNDKKLIGQVDKQNVTVHRWFKKKACPGNYCMDKLPWIVQQVNLRLGAANPSQTSAYTIGGVDYRPVFDPVYYNTRYPDLNAVFHGNAEHLWSHFVNFGRKEGRRASANFDPVVYRFNNPDLNSAFGDDWPKYYEHYLTFGMAEGRVGA